MEKEAGNVSIPKDIVSEEEVDRIERMAEWRGEVVKSLEYIERDIAAISCRLEGEHERMTSDMNRLEEKIDEIRRFLLHQRYKIIGVGAGAGGAGSIILAVLTGLFGLGG